MRPRSLLPAALVIALGITSAGALVGRGFESGRRLPPTVVVKGLAERVVRADLVVWPLRLTVTGDDLAALQQRLDRDLERLRTFLVEGGIEPEAIRPQRVEVTDLLAQPYRPEGGNQNRFILARTVIVRTDALDQVAALDQATGDLVGTGIVLQDTGGPVHLFTGLNAIKPEMLAEATRNARASAAQFAADAGSTIAGISAARQGVFQILPADPVPGAIEAQQAEKLVRVVSTITYQLEE